jgi:hypothetical protein
MPKIDFDLMPPEARLWVFASDSELGDEARDQLLARVDAFLDSWNAHGSPLTAARDWREGRFLLVAVDERSAPPSGCSIDALLRELKAFEAAHGLCLTDHANVLWRSPSGQIESTDRPSFARLAKGDEVGLETPVFDTTLTRVADVRGGGLEVPAGASWHRRAFWRQSASAVTTAIAMLALSLSACSAPDAAQDAGVIGDSRDGFVTLIGEDTLAVEDLVYDDGGVTVEVLLRSPQVVRARYRLDQADDGALLAYRAELWSGVNAQGEPERVEVVEPGAEGGWTYTRTVAGESESRAVEVDTYAVPFVDQLHWPFDAALQARVGRGEVPEGDLAMLSGARSMTYGVVRDASGSLGLRHPTRGVSAIVLDDDGRLLSLDGYGTTRALTVERVAEVDVNVFAPRFEALGPMGELSGRGESEIEVDGALVALDWGTPMKRGREIFGKLVAYGEVWRTGANTATHITLDRDLVFGGSLEVPAGTYTLFSIPREDGAALIFNTLTGINGQGYDAEANLGQVEMRREALEQSLERFTIAVRDTEAGGVLELLWDQTAYRVDFEVR